jgi:ribonuclease HI
MSRETPSEAAPRVLTAYTDGAARGNPGPAGAGVQILDAHGACVAEKTQYLGETTNNVAEYQALILALESALELGAQALEVRSDSELMVRQMTGRYRVKHPGLLPLFERAKALARRLGRVEYAHVRREANREADRLANQAIEEGHARGREASGERP